MATLVAQTMHRSGIEATYDAAAAGGDDFVNTEKQFIHIKNGSGADITLSIITPGTIDTCLITNRTVVIPAGEQRIIGLFPAQYYNDANGKVSLTYSDVTSLFIAILTLGAS